MGPYEKMVVFAPGEALGTSLDGRLLALGSLEASRHHDHVFFWRQGGPLGAAKACVIANYDGKTNGFLMFLLFALSGLGGVPGSIKI